MKNLIIILLSFGVLNLTAQSLEKQVIGSAGGTSTAGNITLSATVGETSVETKTGTFILTEGYHQGFEAIGTAINEQEIEVKYSLYPNPSSDIINVKLNASEFIEASIHIYNTIGEKVSETKSLSGTETRTNFNINTLPSGIYYLNIVSKNKVIKVISFQKI